MHQLSCKANDIFFVFCGSVMGIPCEIITPKQVAQLHPLINIHDLVGAMYVPEDALVSSANVSLALATAASRNGTRFLSPGALLPDSYLLPSKGSDGLHLFGDLS